MGGGSNCPRLFERVCRPPQGADIRMTLGDFSSFCIYFFLEKKNFGPRDKKDPSRAFQNNIFFEKNQKFC